jgi:hypothetical protein
MRLSFLELPADERRLYIEQAAARRNVSPVILEKDFWVSWLLGILFESQFAGSLVFKGGTSLSKVFGVIDRFSEDSGRANSSAAHGQTMATRSPARFALSHQTRGSLRCGVITRRCATCTSPSRSASTTFSRRWQNWNAASTKVHTPRLLNNDDLCPCRSGKTFGACCLREGRAAYQDGIPLIQMPSPPPELAEILNEERQRQARFGQVRSAIHADWQGQKWVAIGNKLLHSPNWKTPADFLSDYLKYVMSPAWGKAELAKPLPDRHPVMLA